MWGAGLRIRIFFCGSGSSWIPIYGSGSSSSKNWSKWQYFVFKNADPAKKRSIFSENGPFWAGSAKKKKKRIRADPDPDPQPWWGANPNMVSRIVKVARFGPFSRDCIGDSFRVSRRFHFSTTAMNGFVRQIAFDNSRTKMPWPGFEPGLLRPQRRVLTTRRSRLVVFNWQFGATVHYLYCDI